MAYKLGSLFDGSGGFPLAGSLCGIEPIWAAEVEPYPIAVTRERFNGREDNPIRKLVEHHAPNMKLYMVHLGDISKVNGGEIEPVDIITFGSPCQDLSVAGKRAGLKHEANGDEETTRSGLFMEAVRIIKEMREATNGKYPAFALWENVPGAFSSNKGEDFRIVCEELIKIVEPTAFMPPVPKNGWNYADSYVGDGWSIAYRVFDAQYWGVPQRRRRIHLVADFSGQRAREVLFEREGVRGYFATGRTPWQTTPADAQGGTGADDREGEGFDGYNGDLTGGVSSTLGVNCGVPTGRNGVIERDRGLDAVGVINAIGGNAENSQETETFPTLTNGTAPGFNNAVAVPYTLKIRGGVEVDSGGKAAPTLVGDHHNRVTDHTGIVVYAVDQGGGKSGANVSENQAPTLCTTHGGEPVIAFDRAAFNQGQNAKYDFEVSDSGVNSTLVARGPSGVAYGTDVGWLNSCEDQSPTLLARQYKDPHLVSYTDDTHYIVRRLTPTECARLQGFADWWGIVEQKDSLTDEEYQFWLEVRNTHAAINGKKVQDYTEKQMLTWYNKLWTDSSEYKMWGNGIALPTALYCMQGIVDAIHAEEDEMICQ